MKFEWKKVRLGDVCKKIGSGATPRGGKESYKNSGISLIRSQNVLDFAFSNEGLAFIDDKQAQQLENVIVQKSDVLINITGDSVARACITPDEYLPARVNQHVSIVRTDPQIADPHFVLYFLQQQKAHLLSIGSSGGTRNALTKRMLEELSLPLPDISTQRTIAATLYCLDDKITNNTKINHHLEQMAQAIFKSWFVDFEPFGGIMPSDWREGTLGEYCDVKSGFAFKSSWWQEQGLKVIKIKNITNTGLDLTDCSFVSDDKIPYAKDFIAQPGDLLIAMTGATIGKFAIVPQHYETLLVNQRVGKFSFKDSVPNEKIPYLWCSLKQESVFNEIINRGQGSAQPNISPKDIMTIPIVIPFDEVLKEFNQSMQSCFETMTTNAAENEKLALIRNSLLPRLLSGELPVFDLGDT